jgi:YD repeat-containing protein
VSARGEPRKACAMIDKTIAFGSVHHEHENEMREILITVYEALLEKGYNPINQLVGYILSEDPTYITTYNNARSLIRHIDRDELLQMLVKSYLAD